MNEANHQVEIAFREAEAALAGLEALKLGKGHRVDGVEYGRDAARGVTQVVVRGEVAALVSGRLGRGRVMAALSAAAGQAMPVVSEAILEALQAHSPLPEGHSLSGPDQGEVILWMQGVGSPTASFRLHRATDIEGGLSGEVRLVMRGGGSHLEVFLTCEARGVTLDQATVIAGDSVSALIAGALAHLKRRVSEVAGASLPGRPATSVLGEMS